MGKTRRRPGEVLVGSQVIPRGTRESGGGEEDPYKIGFGPKWTRCRLYIYVGK